MKKSIFILTMLFCQIALAQEKGTIKGTLLDKEMNNEPLSFAGVVIKGTTIGTETDFDGNYILTVDPGSYTLVFSFLGYQQLELNVVVKSNETTTANAILEASEGVALEEVKLRAVTSKEKESALLIEQKKAVTIDQKIGSEELSKKGALYFKEGGGNFNIDNFYTDGIDLGVKVKSTDAEAAVRIENGDLVMTNVEFVNNAAGFVITDYTGANQSFVTEGTASGAGNGATVPDWANGWTRF